MDIKKKAYEKYKLWWMINHEFTLKNLVDQIQSCVEEDGNKNINLESAFINWEDEYGFGGEIWACYDEFLDHEYKNKDIMKEILDVKSYKIYLEDLK